MENQVVTFINQTDLQDKQSIIEQFSDFFTQASGWDAKARQIVITSVEQKAEMKMAREARLALKAIRVETEKRRKTLKEESLRRGQTIDAIAKIITNTITPIEEYLTEQEKYVERMEEQKKQEVYEKRIEELRPYEPDLLGIDLKNMTDEMFILFLDSSKKAHEEKIQKELERIEQEKKDAEERERIRQENEKLKKEAEEREKQIKAQEMKVQKEKEDAENKIRELEKTKKDQEEKALQDKKEAEERVKQAEQALLEEQNKKIKYTCEKCGHIAY
jgi:colicin import membrane protein